MKKATKVAVISLGCVDGLILEDGKKRRSLLGRQKGTCEMGGQTRPLIGQPGYTSTLVDVTDTDCTIGDTVSFDISPRFVNPFVRRDYV